MDVVHIKLAENTITGEFFNESLVRMKTGDENVYEIVDMENFMEVIKSGEIHNTIYGIKLVEIPVFVKIYAELGYELDPTVEIGDIFHIRAYNLDKIGSKKYFVKNFHYRSDWTNFGDGFDVSYLPLHKQIEFKKVDKKFYLQVLKYYLGKPIVDADLYFMDSGIVAKYQYSIFE
jgi:hypothetical protein